MRSLLLLALAGCVGSEHASDPREVPSAEATRVEVVTLEAAPAALSLSLPGEVEGSRDALLASGGGLVEAVLVRPGDRVRKGQTLLRIDVNLVSAQVDQAEAQHAQAAAALKRVQQLGDMASSSQRIDAETAEKVASAGVRQARAQLDRARITAPFDGVVADVAVEVGESANPGAPVLRLVQLDPVLVTLAVSDRDVVSLSAGSPVTVAASARSGSFPGTIRHVAPAADMRTRAFPVEVEVPNPDERLLPGMIARVSFEQALSDDVLVVPQEWIVTRRSEHGVFVEVEGTAVWRPVELGAVIRHDVVVEQGLSPGERVVITGHRDLIDGDPLLVARAGTCCREGRPVFEGAR